MEDLLKDVRVNAGSQVVTRNAAERGEGVIDALLADLLAAYDAGSR